MSRTGHPTSPPHAESRCPWCGATIPSAALSCPGCGAPVKRSLHATQSGWVELPAIKDMARLRIGNSTCQIEGKYVPVADFNLSATESLYFAHHVVLWKDPQVEIKKMPLKGGFKRLMAGLPLVMTEAAGPGHIAFSRDEPGEMIALPLQSGQSIDVCEHLLLVATREIAYNWFSTNIWYQTKSGNDSETHYPLGMFMDQFTAGAQPGLLLLHASGNVFVRDLKPNQTLLIKPKSLVYKDPSVQMGLKIDSLMSNWVGVNRMIWLHLCGPGRVAVQSAYEPVEDVGRSIVNHTPSPFRFESVQTIVSHVAAQTADNQTPHPTDPRHILVAGMVRDALAAGQISPQAMAQMVQVALQHGMCEYDVKMIIKHVMSHGN